MASKSAKTFYLLIDGPGGEIIESVTTGYTCPLVPRVVVPTRIAPLELTAFKVTQHMMLFFFVSFQFNLTDLRSRLPLIEGGDCRSSSNPPEATLNFFHRLDPAPETTIIGFFAQ